MAGCTSVGMRRCARFGRAPAIYDLTFAFTLWGFLGGAPDDLVAWRGPLFRSASHHSLAQRAIADSVARRPYGLRPRRWLSGWATGGARGRVADRPRGSLTLEQATSGPKAAAPSGGESKPGWAQSTRMPR